jgi:DNA-binding transcriptional LysR family regulator
MWDLFDGVIAFHHVMQERSFRGASERLEVTPAAVSKAVGRLEERLGLELLHRTTRRVRPSEEGEVFYAYCREAIAQVRAGRDRLEMMQESPRGRLRVSASDVLGPFLSRRLPAFLERYRSLELELDFSDRNVDLIEDQVDVAVRIGEPRDSSLRIRPLMETRWATVASPEYLAQRGGAPEDPGELEAHNCLMFRTPYGTVTDWEFREAPGSESVRTVAASGNLVANEGRENVRMAVHGMGICHAFYFMVADELGRGELVELFADLSAPGPPIHALYLPEQRKTPRVRAFLDFLVDAFAELGPRARRGYES